LAREKNINRFDELIDCANTSLLERLSFLHHQLVAAEKPYTCGNYTKPVRVILGRSAIKLGDSANGALVEPPGLAKAQVDIWSTDAARARERFSYWRDMVCQAVFNISIKAPPETFSASISSRSSGALRFATSECSGYQVVRTRRDIESAPADHYSIYLQVQGQAVINQGDDTYVFQPNDIGIADGRLPFHADLSGVGRRAIAVIPRSMLNQRAPWLRSFRKLSASSPFIDLARRHLLELTAPDSQLSDSETGLLSENLCNLLALASAPKLEPSRLRPSLQIEALLAFCQQHLHDPELSPQFVAARLGISVRTLHLRFKQIGQTFGRWVLETASLRAASHCAIAISVN
jgi:AraC family transcriptional activator of tynA and feaB